MLKWIQDIPDKRFDRLVMSGMFVIMASMVLVLLMFLILGLVPDNVKDMVCVAMTALLGRLGTMTDFWHGGSRSSTGKAK